MSLREANNDGSKETRIVKDILQIQDPTFVAILLYL